MSNIKPNGLYCAYLRKSRRDEEAEAAGQGETLARHERQLQILASRLGIRVAQWYREIVSGDTIAARPQIQQLLADVNRGLWDGVLVVDVDRLARGDSMDQGLVMQSIACTGTLIVTPDKIYDPADEADAEFFEVKLFFARREYGMIKKRLQRGRIASVMDGCYLGPDIYGYERYKLPGRKGWSLRPVPEEAEIVRAVYAWYADGMDGAPVGCNRIAYRLNDMGLRTKKGYPWERSVICSMLQNPTYIGMVRWNQKVKSVRIEDGQRVESRVPSDAPILVDGLHEPIVDPALFARVQQMFRGHARRPLNTGDAITNPLAGLIRCDQCGRAMQRTTTASERHHTLATGERRIYKYVYGEVVRCCTRQCPTVPAPLAAVESAILSTLRGWIVELDAEPPAPAADPTDAARAQLTAQRDALRHQLDRQYDLLEQSIYTMDEFRRRRADITARLAAAETALQNLHNPTPPDPRRALLPQLRTVVDTYADAPTPARKNALLRSVVDHITYHKTQRCWRNNQPGDNLTVTIYPRIVD